MPQFTGTRDLRSYVRVIWRWKWLLILIVVAVPAIAYFLEHRKPHTYASTVLVSVSAAGLAGSGSSTDNIDAIAALVATTPVADIAGDFLKPPLSGASIVGDVSATPNITTGFLTITATTGSPTQAAAIANAFARALGVDQKNQVVAQARTAIAALRAQIAQLPKNSAEREPLEADIQTDQAQLATASQGAQILQAATPNYTPVGPHVRQAVELGLLIGLLLAFAVVMIAESADRRLRGPDDLEALTGLPLLAAIGPSAFDSELDTSPVDAEAFQTLRTSLTYFTIDEPIKSVLVTSPGEQEGKSTVAVRLALASAIAGLDVVLVDADLRRGGATVKLGLRPRVGLGLVLAEQRPVESALIEWTLSEEAAGRLRVLGAGEPPPNPAALVSSSRMREVIETLERQVDLVVIDTPAALAVSDAVPMMQNVSGVVLIARMNRSNRDTVRRLQKIIASAHGRILGAVATGVTAGPGYETYSQSYYTPTGGGHKTRRFRRRHKSVSARTAPPQADDAQSDNGIAPLRIGTPRTVDHASDAQ
jgi:capsular exopolysaccharide synthesis family protein